MSRPFLQMFADSKGEFTRKTGKLPGQDDTKYGKNQEHFRFGPMPRTYQNNLEVLVQIILILLGRHVSFAL